MSEILNVDLFMLKIFRTGVQTGEMRDYLIIDVKKKQNQCFFTERITNVNSHNFYYTHLFLMPFFDKITSKYGRNFECRFIHA